MEKVESFGFKLDEEVSLIVIRLISELTAGITIHTFHSVHIHKDDVGTFGPGPRAARLGSAGERRRGDSPSLRLQEALDLLRTVVESAISR